MKADQTKEPSLARNFYLCQSEGSVEGPFALEQISSMWLAGAISATAQVCEEGANEWRPVVELISQARRTNRSRVIGILILLAAIIGLIVGAWDLELEKEETRERVNSLLEEMEELDR